MYRHHRHIFGHALNHMYRDLPQPVQDHPYVSLGGFLLGLFLLLSWLRRLIIESEEKATVKAKKKDFNRWDPRAGGAGATWASTALPPTVKKAAQRGERGAVLQWAQGSATDVDARDADGKSVLHHACNHGHAELARALIEAGASPDAADAAGETPLHCAAKAGSAAAVRVLLDNGADAFVETKGRETPAQLAMNAGNHGCARLIQRKEREQTSNATSSDGAVLRRAGKGGNEDDAV